MSKRIRPSILTLAVACMTLMLGGCGESTNIREGNGSDVTECSSLLNVSCVPGRFVDDAASNINYECGLATTATVRSVTSIDGGFSCPAGSTVKFSLINPDAQANRIELGSVQIVLPAQIYGGNPENPIYFYVTPRTLAGDSPTMPFSTKALNITRLLQTLSDDTVDAALDGHLPSRRVIISDADKRKITAAVLPTALNFSAPAAGNPAIPTAGSFDEQVHDYLASLGTPAKQSLITASQAQAALQKGVHNTIAGVYQVPGGSILTIRAMPGGTNFNSADLGAMVGYEPVTGKSFVSSMYMLADRRGRVVGHGIYSYGKPAGTSLWNPWSDPQPMEIVKTGADVSGLPLWPNGGTLTQFRFQMLGGADAGKYVRIDQGVMSREAVAGSANVYAQLFKESSAPGLLGKWSLGDLTGSTTEISAGVYTLEHTLAVATLMDPDIWAGITFPLPITVSVYNRDYGNTACTGGRGCKIADIRMVVLQDGNIISDRFKTCGASVDPETLVVNGNVANQELPMGVVSSSQSGFTDGSASTFKAMVLLSMLSGDTRLGDTMVVTPGYEQYVPYLQFGSNLRASFSLLRVDSGTNQFQMYGYCTADDVTLGQCTTADTFQPKMGSWINGYTAMRLLQASANSAPAATIAELAVNSEGLMEAHKTDAADCLAPPP